MIRSTTPGTCAHAGGQVPPAREKLPVILRGFSVAPNHPGTQAWTMSTRRMETQGNRCHGETADPPGFQERGLKPPPPALGPGGEGCHALVPPIGSRPQRSQLPGSEDVCLASSPQAAVVQPLGLRAHVLPALLLCCLFLALPDCCLSSALAFPSDLGARHPCRGLRGWGCAHCSVFLHSTGISRIVRRGVSPISR